jgi:hypothetical protein
MTELILSADIETTGGFLAENEIVSLGYVFGDFSGNVVKKNRISFYYDEKKVEQRCMREYWSDHAGQLEMFRREAIDPETGIKKFMQDLTEYEKSHDVIILTDNSAFDVAFLNIYIRKYAGPDCRILQYQGDRYRGVYDILELVMERSPDKFIYDKKNSKNAVSKITSVSHDHWPENDAEFNYRKCLALISANNNNRVRGNRMIPIFIIVFILFILFI